MSFLLNLVSAKEIEPTSGVFSEMRADRIMAQAAIVAAKSQANRSINYQMARKRLRAQTRKAKAARPIGLFMLAPAL